MANFNSHLLRQIAVVATGLAIAPCAIAQSSLNVDSLFLRDSLELDSTLFARGVNAQFSKILDPAANTNIGNFAGIDLKEASVAFGASTMGSKGNYWAVKFSGSVTDGLSSIWENRELNNDVRGSLQWHILGKNPRRLLYDTDKEDSVYANLRKLELERGVCAGLAAHRQKQIALIAELEKRKLALRAEEKADSSLLVLLKASHPGISDDWPSGLSADTLREIYSADTNARKHFKLWARLPSLRDTLEQREKELKEMTERNALRACKTAFASGFQKLVTPFSATGADLHWTSIGLTYTSSKFKLYNDSVAYGDQVDKHTYGTVEVTVQWSRYHRDLAYKRSNFFISFGASGGITDNHEDLKEATLEDRTVQVGPDSTYRTEIANYKVLEGDYNKDLGTASVFMDYYHFVGKKKNNAFHLFPSARFKEKEYPVYNLGIGFMIGYVQKDKPANVVNSEVYFTFPDLSNNNETKGNSWDRSDFGLRFTFPITFTNNR